MTASKQHPQRCETCKHLKNHDILGSYCEISGRRNQHGTLFMERVAELGCASHSSQPVPDGEKCCITCINVPCKILDRVPCPRQENPCEDNGCTDIENCDEICQHSRIYSPIQMQEGKKAAVKAERERVLDAAISTFSNWRKSTKSADSEEMYDSVIAKLESLRGGEP